MRVLVRTGRELAGVVSANLYRVDDPTRVVVAFLGKAVTPARLGLGELDAYAPDELTQIRRELFISVPNGPLEVDGGPDEASAANGRHGAQLAHGRRTGRDDV